jgi:hypothetical protein
MCTKLTYGDQETSDKAKAFDAPYRSPFPVPLPYLHTVSSSPKLAPSVPASPLRMIDRRDHVREL